MSALGKAGDAASDPIGTLSRRQGTDGAGRESSLGKTRTIEREGEVQGAQRTGRLSPPDPLLETVALQHLIASRGGRTPGAGEVTTLQRLAGNRATTELLVGNRAATDLPIIQRVTRASRRGREGRKAREARQRREATQAPSWTWGGVASSLWGMVSGGISGKGEGGASEIEGETTSGDEEEEEKKDLLEIPKLVIELPEQQFERQIAGGGGKASGSTSGSLKGGLDGVEAEGKGELKAQLGLEGGLETGDLSYKLAGGELSGKGEIKAFAGHKAELSGEMGLSGEGASAKGKVAAFSGISLDSETEISIKAGDRELGKFKGALGAAIGVGGELSGHISYKGGVFRYGTKGKFAAGAGFSWTYEFEVNVAPLATGVFSWLSSLGSAAHEFLTDEEGEPIPL
jgi:hypothetical protein